MFVCLCVCTVTRIKLAASNFAQWFRGILGRESPILGNFAPPEVKNRTNRPVYIYIQTYVYACECMSIYVCMYVYIRPQLRHQDNVAEQACPQAMRSIGMCGYTAVPKTDVLVLFAISVNNFICKLVLSHLWLLYIWS